MRTIPGRTIPMNIEISRLFSSERLTGGNLSSLRLLVYMPIGLVLTLLRLIIGFQVFLISCLLPRTSALRRVILRMMCLLLGIVISHEGLEHRDKKAKVIVANHISVFDHVTIGLVVPVIIPNVWSLSPYLTWALGYTEMGAREGRATLLLNLKKHCESSEIPIASLPEGSMTNGQVGLLKFSTWPFDLGETIQPVILTVSRPLLRVNVESIGSSLWKDIFWFLFVPLTHFHVRLLPSEEKAHHESVEDYTRRVQKLMANELGTAVTAFTSADKAEYVNSSYVPPVSATRSQANLQRSPTLRSASPHTSSPSVSEGSLSTDRQQLLQMITQVLDVLPEASEAAVKMDLEKTNCVDTTITNILEGRVTTEALKTPEKTSSSGVRGVDIQPSSTPSPNTVTYAAPLFDKSSRGRQMSYIERKKALLETARRYYMAKHNVTE